MSHANGVHSLRPYYEFVDDTPQDMPGRFAFCIPTIDALNRWADYPVAALPGKGRAGSGRGLSQQECEQSGLGEAIELASVCAWGDEPLIRASAAELGETAIAPPAVAGFGQTQITQRATWNAGPFGTLDWRPPPFDPQQALDWIAARDAHSQTQVWIAADQALIGRCERGDETAIAYATTTGCATGPNAEAARLSAVLEVLERDAIGLWWYSERRARACPPEILHDVPVLHDFLTTRARITRFLDISTDLSGPVIAAVSWDTGGGRVAIGFAARAQPPVAARQAAIELLQTEIGLDQRRDLDDPLEKLWVDTITCDDPAFAPLGMISAQPDRQSSVTEIAERLHRAGHRLCFVDLTRRAFDIPVFRAVATGLASDKPRFGSPRYGPCTGMADRLPLLI